MKTMLLLGAATLAASVITPASAENYKYVYTFYSSSGAAYCDGVEFNYSKGLAIGYQIYDGTTCTTPPFQIVGTESHIKLMQSGEWFFFPESGAQSGSPNDLFFFFLDVKALKWELYYEASDYGIPFSLLNAGSLVAGPPQYGGANSLGSVVKAGLKHVKRKDQARTFGP